MKIKDTLKIKLTDLIDAIQSHLDMGDSVVHLKTGNIYFISEGAIDIADEEINDFPAWQEAEIKIAKHYLENPDEYLSLPSQHEVNEYQMMEAFTENLENEKIADQLLIAMKGTGAFRRFRDTVILWNLEDEWYKFKDEKYRKFAIEWCEENDFVLI